MPKGVYKHNPDVLMNNLKFAIEKNKGRKYPEEHKLAISKGVSKSYVNNDELIQLRRDVFSKNRDKIDWGKMVNTRRLNNSYTISPEQRIKASNSMKRLFDEHPEKHPNRRMANRKTLYSQQKLFDHVKQYFPEAIMEFRIPNTRRFADIAIPSLKIDIEFDGKRWHNPEEDRIRDSEIATQGWRVIRYTGQIFGLWNSKV